MNSPHRKTGAATHQTANGINEPAYQHPVVAWHYAWTRVRGETPMIRWSAFSDPARSTIDNPWVAKDKKPI